jgi:crotonobetainyl-CoA:carnitine CoA-transferase CaiB-like acyl-CoA transferase
MIDILADTRVVDLCHAVAGPSGSQLLGDLGAEVIKIEPPETGDFTRGATPRLGGESFFFLAVNRNKKSVVLDLTTGTGRATLHDLARVSDVVFDNFRPGVLERLGADFETLKTLNPGIISCSVTGFGPSGPYRDHPAFDDIAEGLSGVYSLCGEPGGKPIRVPLHVADLAAGFFAATGIVAALLKRQHTGIGCRVEVNMLDAVMYYLATDFQSYFVSGEVPGPSGSRHARAPMVGIFQTRDGYLVLGPSWPRIAKAIGREWMVEDPRFASVEKRFENKRELEDLIEESLRQADTEEWLKIMRAEDIAAGPVNRLDQAVSDAQVVHNRTVTTMKHHSLGDIRGIDCPIKIGGVTECDHLPPPMLGQHTEQILRELLGCTDERLDALRQEAAAARSSGSRGHSRM